MKAACSYFSSEEWALHVFVFCYCIAGLWPLAIGADYLSIGTGGIQQIKKRRGEILWLAVLLFGDGVVQDVGAKGMHAGLVCSAFRRFASTL